MSAAHPHLIFLEVLRPPRENMPTFFVSHGPHMDTLHYHLTLNQAYKSVICRDKVLKTELQVL